jgi:hypothetical protein
VGLYSFGWTDNGIHPLLVRKAGFAVRDPSSYLSNGTEVKNASVNGDTRLDIQLIRR